MRFAYYPGCSLHSTGREYDASFREVCARLGLEPDEVEGWTCCGASSAHATSRLLSVALAADNLARVETAGHKDVVVPCASCFSRFKDATHEIESDPGMKAEIGGILGRPFSNSVKTIHPLELLDKMGEEGRLGAAPVKEMPGVRAVCYYGCLLTRPPKVTQFDDCEYPMSMDRLLGRFGVRTLDWSYKTDCCGAGFGLTRPAIVCKLVKKILDNALAAGANVVAVACPLCHANLDSRQADLNRAGGNGAGPGAYKMPVLYFTQLIGLALGAAPESLGLGSHLVETAPVLGMMR